MVVGTDTDLFVMLVARATPNINLYMLVNHSPITMYSVSAIQKSLQDLAPHLPFLHAMTGCKTTSVLYNQGKRKALNLARSDKTCHSHMQVFANPVSSHEEVSHAGERFLVSLYGGGDSDTLDTLRPKYYKRMICRQQ